MCCAETRPHVHRQIGVITGQPVFSLLANPLEKLFKCACWFESSQCTNITSIFGLRSRVCALRGIVAFLPFSTEGNHICDFLFVSYKAVYPKRRNNFRVDPYWEGNQKYLWRSCLPSQYFHYHYQLFYSEPARRTTIQRCCAELTFR